MQDIKANPPKLHSLIVAQEKRVPSSLQSQQTLDLLLLLLELEYSTHFNIYDISSRLIDTDICHILGKYNHTA